MEKKNWRGKKKGARDRESFLRVPMTEVRFNVGRAWGGNRNFFVLYSLFFTVDDPCPVVRINAKLSSR